MGTVALTSVSAIQRLAQSCRCSGQLTGDTAGLPGKMTCGGSGAPDEEALGVAGMRHDTPPVVWKPRRTIAFLTETAFQGLPLQLLMPRRSSSAAMARSD
jgi:hypothetical protein